MTNPKPAASTNVSPDSIFPLSYRTANVDGLEVFYRQAGPKDAPTLVLLHGFPSSSHMFRDLIPKLSADFHLVAPDFIGFGYSAHPSTKEFAYTFENLAKVVEKLLFEVLKLKKFSIYVQDYGSPVGFRIASANPEAIQAIVVQNGNAYEEGLSQAWKPITELWASRSAETEQKVRGLLTPEGTKGPYVFGARHPERISPDSYTFDQHFLDRPGNDAVQLELFYNYSSNVALYPQWQAYFRKHQPRMLVTWGVNDPFFTVAGAKAYLRDVPNAELHLLEAGHFALEEESATIADLIRRFFSANRLQQVASSR